MFVVHDLLLNEMKKKKKQKNKNFLAKENENLILKITLEITSTLAVSALKKEKKRFISLKENPVNGEWKSF